MSPRTIRFALASTALAAPAFCLSSAAQVGLPSGGTALPPFQRIATFPIFANSNIANTTSAEIVTVSGDGNTLVYTDASLGVIGFVDITDPANPQPGGTLAVTGSPTSVAGLGNVVLAAVDTSVDFVNPSGNLEIIDVASRQIIRTIALGGQPDCVAVSPDGQYAAVAIENQRDEDLGSGAPPQAPGGFVVIVDIVGGPSQWSTRVVDLAGVPDLFPTDPEPEFIDINTTNVAVVTMQENNHIALIDLATGRILIDFPAGEVDLTDVDTNENDLIEQTESLAAVPREPDAVAWLSPFTFATADEGDLFGGSRGFTNWAPWGIPLFQAGNSVEHALARVGHYPESRSENKGGEPESAELGDYAGEKYLFVGSERGNVVLVYRLLGSVFNAASNPVLVQILPTGVAPEGLLAIPSRNLFVTVSEEDSRSDLVRGALMIYELNGNGNYPEIVSADRAGSTAPIPWAALSGLVTAPGDDTLLYSLHDSYYESSRAFAIDRSSVPARITSELVLRDGQGVLDSALRRAKYNLPGTDDFVVADLLNADGSANLDGEGIAVESDGVSFWIASEGAGNLVGGVSNPSSEPFTSPNLLVRAVLDPITGDLDVVRVVGLPFELARNQSRFGLEGIAVADDLALYVCLQRAWTNAGDPSDRARIGRFDLQTGRWTFAYYPLDAPASPLGGWVGLSEISYLGNGELAILERDNQAGADTRVKRVYRVNANSVVFKEHFETASFETLAKTLEIDLLAAGTYDALGGVVPEKLEGMAVLSDGTALIVNDNDGVDGSSGETNLVRIDALFQ